MYENGRNKKDIPLISIGYRNDWADIQWLTADPQEFASCINQAEAVVTNFFHGCVFALISSKPFLCETSPYRSHKVQDLIKKINGGKHLITEDLSWQEYDTLLCSPLEETIGITLQRLRHSSDIFLEKVLSDHPEYHETNMMHSTVHST